LGYAFVNFTRPEYVDECYRLVDGQLFGSSCTSKKCQVTLAHMQGNVGDEATIAIRPRRKGTRKSQAMPLILNVDGDPVDSESPQPLQGEPQPLPPTQPETWQAQHQQTSAHQSGNDQPQDHLRQQQQPQFQGQQALTQKVRYPNTRKMQQPQHMQ
jgi:hypothetical protein